MVRHMDGFVIKVGDLLRNAGQLDTFPFEHIMLSDIPNLSEDWVSGTLTLQWVSDGSVKVIIKQAKATLRYICDLSTEEYDADISIKNFDGRFVADMSEHDDGLYDDLFPLDPQSETINIYDLLVQGIKLQEPIVHIKPGKEYLLDEYAEDEDEEYDQWSWNILFH